MEKTLQQGSFYEPNNKGIQTEDNKTKLTTIIQTTTSLHNKSCNCKENTVLSIKDPDKYATIDEKYNNIVKMSTNIELYCPEIDSNLKSYRNIKNILAHATNAYMMNKELCQDIENTENKISCLEEKTETCRKSIKKEKTRS